MSEFRLVPQVEPSSADSKIGNGAVLLDVREPDEWAAGHDPRAVHIPLGAVAASSGQLPKDVEIMVICRAGGRSQKAAEFLRAQGYAASNVTGGMQAWAAQRLSVITDAGNPGAVI